MDATELFCRFIAEHRLGVEECEQMCAGVSFGALRRRLADELGWRARVPV